MTPLAAAVVAALYPADAAWTQETEGIESLPGPQGTLFGSSSQSGTLRIITNKPDHAGFSAQLEGVLGTTRGGEESYDLNGWVNIPLTRCTTRTTPTERSSTGKANTYDKEIRQTAVFGELTWSLTDNWDVTGGIRWFEYDREQFDIYEIPKGLPIFGAWDTGGVQRSAGVANDTVLKFSTQYHVDDDRMMYFIYSEGFRLGGNNSIRAANTGQIPLTYGPDTLTNYETGLKSEWLDNRLQLNVSVFHMEWDDIQINDRAADGPWWARGTANAGAAETTGAEIHGTWYVTDNLLVEASLFVADPEFAETFVKQDGDVIEKGMPMPNSPERKYWAAVQYTVPDLDFVDGDLWFRYDTSYQSETINTLTNVIERDPTGIIPSWTTANFQVGLEMEDWQVSLMARNVWDEENVNWLYTPFAGQFFGDPRFNVTRSLQKPRTISLTVRKTFQ